MFWKHGKIDLQIFQKHVSMKVVILQDGTHTEDTIFADKRTAIDPNEENNDLVSFESDDSSDIENNDHDTSKCVRNDENNNILALNISIESLAISDTSITTQSTSKKMSRKRVIWSPLCAFDSYTEARDFLDKAGYKKHDTKRTKTGSKSFWRCGAIKQRSKEKCASKRMIFQEYSQNGYQIFGSNTDHTCDKIPEIHHAKLISDEMGKIIMSCAGKRMTTKMIVKHINELRESLGVFLNEKTPSESQIVYIIRKNKQIKAPKMLFLGQLIEWCEKNIEVPEDIDTPFVIGFDHSDEINAFNFRIVVSTKRMLKHCNGIEKLCVDATYKLVWNGFPFMVLGTIDRVKKFHALCFALCVNETTEDYRFIFDTLADNVLKLTGTIFEPRILISDAALAIRNAFSMAFPAHDLMVMCFVHVLRNVNKHKDKYKKENKKEIIEGIMILQLAPSREIFDTMSALFIKKWKKKDPLFASYFQQQWLDSHCNWFEGAAEYTPSTNNSLEGIFSLLQIFVIIFQY